MFDPPDLRLRHNPSPTGSARSEGGFSGISPQPCRDQDRAKQAAYRKLPDLVAVFCSSDANGAGVTHSSLRFYADCTTSNREIIREPEDYLQKFRVGCGPHVLRGHVKRLAAAVNEINYN